MQVRDPIQIGELLRKLFILREDGSIDHDMLIAHLRAEELHQQSSINHKPSARLEETLARARTINPLNNDKDQSREPAGLDGEFRPQD